MHGQTIININELYKGATLISYPSLIFVVPVFPYVFRILKSLHTIYNLTDLGVRTIPALGLAAGNEDRFTFIRP